MQVATERRGIVELRCLLPPEFPVPAGEQPDQMPRTRPRHPFERQGVERGKALTLEGGVCHELPVHQPARMCEGAGHLPEDGLNAVLPRRLRHALRRHLQAISHRGGTYRAPSIHGPVTGGHHHLL